MTRPLASAEGIGRGRESQGGEIVGIFLTFDDHDLRRLYDCRKAIWYEADILHVVYPPDVPIRPSDPEGFRFTAFDLINEIPDLIPVIVPRRYGRFCSLLIAGAVVDSEIFGNTRQDFGEVAGEGHVMFLCVEGEDICQRPQPKHLNQARLIIHRK